ncbi:uncharacterized protein LOC104581898 [Brachypodium distachyon]|uniref:Uncharacterized protein n=1 Tax=Brachypodium distachyon TaxID=15368 RepID=I1GMX4_BRADI|nr:uncharacterized protein LOC104581898 [Brachypodium distachyon]KQK13021.1 hypothetical protein BRADI_1g07495v3 [Brachypodium distachyon]|eukprot:XP_010229320.1 uncharacterized protein LOC104581898 [Brachypodium distachyon]
MAGLVSVWFAKLGRETATPAADDAGLGLGRRHEGDGVLEVESVKIKGGGVQIQERRRRNSGVLSNSEATVCMLMDRFAPA